MFITAITQANPAVIVTSVFHEYVTGTIVRIYIPRKAQMYQLDGKVYEITVTADNAFSIPVDSTYFDAFVDPADPSNCAQVIPIGERNDILTAAVRNVLTR
jgi:hypothetical protein